MLTPFGKIILLSFLTMVFGFVGWLENLGM